MIWFILILIVIALLIVWLSPKCIERMTSLGGQVIVVKTHVWTPEIEQFVQKIASESSHDLFILAHSDDKSLVNQIQSQDLRDRLIMITANDIKQVYSHGFVSLWLSNHWNTMWFYKQYPNYQYYWFIEYDVRIVGDSSRIWNYEGIEDFVFPYGPYQNPDWAYKNDYFGNTLDDSNKWYGYLQLARYSTRWLEYLNRIFQTGENGQDEMMMFSLLKRAEPLGITGTSKFLGQFIRGSWTVDYRDSDRHRALMAKVRDLTIFHPIK